MKEAFEKLKERLKEADKYHDRIINLGEALSIVSEVEAEYEQQDHTDYANIELYAFWKEHQWIPCSERLPEKPWTYLVCYKNPNCFPSTQFFDGKQFLNVYGNKDTAVIAWMPLPEPYKPEK